MPLGQIDLPVTFGDQFNYRAETLTFEVVGFPGIFHAILGHPCYVKFMTVFDYTYLKLMMLGPHGVITVDTSFQRAYECKVECYGHATAFVTSGELATLREEVTEEAPDAKKSTRSFELVEGSKEVLVDPNSFEGKTVRNGTTLSSNRKSRSSTSSATTKTPLYGNPQICQAFQGRSPSIP
ncbi:uncharacterized protein [Miscanthus floridulus]|uniref:uncharacterized protein n=1 Tax=Miscanthus floridulus TaxID=154761 RepID=UPI0034593824